MKLLRSIAVASALPVAVVVAACQPSSSGSDVTLDSPEQRGSYAQGVRVGSQGRQLPLDTEAFIQGIRDGLADESRMSQEEMQEAQSEFQQVMAESRKADAAENRKAGEEFLAENESREGVEVTESGLQYEVLEEGDGPKPDSGDVVEVHYRGTTVDGEVFDESYSRGEPATFPVGQVIPGWTEGLQLMSVGSKYKFFIPADLAYGQRAPRGASFGPNSTLIFEVELLDIVEEGEEGQEG